MMRYNCWYKLISRVWMTLQSPVSTQDSCLLSSSTAWHPWIVPWMLPWTAWHTEPWQLAWQDTTDPGRLCLLFLNHNNWQCPTFFNLLSRQFLVGSCCSLYNVGEADAIAEQLLVILSIHRSRNQTRQKQTFPCKHSYCIDNREGLMFHICLLTLQ